MIAHKQRNRGAFGRLSLVLRGMGLTVAAALAFLLTAVPASALDVPPAPTQWATDQAGLISGADVSVLNDKLRSFEQQSGVQFLVYILPSVEGDPIEDFTIRCVEKWKVGQKKFDNGLVLFVFVKERKARFEVGYGLEPVLTDAISSRIIREQIAPHFQQQDYAGGLNGAVDAAIAVIRKGGEAVGDPSQRASGRDRQISSTDIQFILFIAFIFLFFILPMLARRSGRRGGCGGCMWPLFFLGNGGGTTFGGGGFGGGSSGWGGGGGGFSGGGGGFGGGGATGGW